MAMARQLSACNVQRTESIVNDLGAAVMMYDSITIKAGFYHSDIAHRYTRTSGPGNQDARPL